MDRWLELSNGHRVWTKTVGDGPGLPLLLLHGGPGAGHDYLEPLEALGSDRPVIFYDQLGCGRSEKPENRALWTIRAGVDGSVSNTCFGNRPGCRVLCWRPPHHRSRNSLQNVTG